MKIRIPRIAHAALTALILCASSQAGILNQYNSRSAYDAATASQTLLDFSRADGTYQQSTSATGIAISPLTFLGYYNDNPTNNRFTFWVDPNAGFGPELDYNTGGVMTGGSNGTVGNFDGGLIVSGFNSGVRTVGLDYAAIAYNSVGDAPIYPTSGALQLWVYEGGASPSFIVNLTIPPHTANPTLGFVGLSTTGDISGIRLVGLTMANALNNRVILDNLAFGQILAGGGGETGSGIPEPQTYVLCAAGLITFYTVRRSRR